MIARLVRLAPAQLAGEWEVPRDGTLVVGRSHGAGRAPDVDLWPDRKVSRRHATLRHADGACWLEDLGSRSGTRIDGASLEKGRSARVAPGAVIELGRSRLLALPNEWALVHHRGRWIELGVGPALSYVLARQGPRLISRAVAHNGTDTALAASRLLIAFDACAHATVQVPALAPGARCELPVPDVHFDLAALEALAERRWLPCRLGLDSDELPDTRLGVWGLPCNEFSFAPAWRSTLAAFVLPNHPLTARVAADARVGRSVNTTADTHLRAVYDHLHTVWRIGYCHEPPEFEVQSQRVRFPHDLLTDLAAKTGQGTCLDLALLMAGALEACSRQPLLAVLDLGTIYHALVGCWRSSGPRLDPVPVDVDRLVSEAIWVDPNGCTRDPRHRSSFEDAHAKATDTLRSQPLLFALDVAAARQDGIVPLPFSGDPQWDPLVVEALERARNCAEEAGQHLSTVPLLIGLLRTRDGTLRRVLALEIADADRAAEQLAAQLGASPAPGGASRNYLATLAGAKAAAKAEAAPLVLERHLVAALLDVPSAALDAALAAIGSGRAAVKGALARVAPEFLSSASDASLFRGPP